MISRNYEGVGSYSIGDAFAGVSFGGKEVYMAYTKQDKMEFSTKGEWKDGKVGGKWMHDNDKLCKPEGMEKVYGKMVNIEIYKLKKNYIRYHSDF